MTDRSLRIARAAAGLALTLSAIVLGGCAAFPTSYAVLDRDAEPADTVPDDVIEQDSGDVADLASARFVGDHSGSSLWLLRGVERSTVCVLAYRDESEWGMGCGGERGPIEISGRPATSRRFPRTTPHRTERPGSPTMCTP